MLDRKPSHYRPPAPYPPNKRLGFLRLLPALAKNPLECWNSEFFHQPVVKMRLPLFEAVLVHDPQAIRRVLLDNAANYRKDPLQRRILSSGLADGLLSVEGPRWEIQRRTLAPLFAKRTVNSFSGLMLNAANAVAAKWTKLGDRAVVDVAAEMTLVTLTVLAVTIFSDGIGTDLDQFRKAMNAYFGVIGKIGILDLLGAPAWMPRVGQARLRVTLDYFETVIQDLIEARRRRLLSTRATEQADDLLSLLLSAVDPSTGQPMGLNEVKSNILTFLSAGHETTANALSWSIFLLSQSPYWADLVREEAARELKGPVEGLVDRLAVTRSVVDEALRLYPPIAAVSRMSERADMLAGMKVNPGSLIVIAPYVLHRHHRHWDQPDLFDPSRFSQDRKNKIDRFVYLPFGTGPRTCIGSSFALQEATIVLAALIQKFDLQILPDSHVWPVQRVTLRPSKLTMSVGSRVHPS